MATISKLEKVGISDFLFLALVALVRYKIILPVLRYPIPYNFYPVLRVAKYLGFDRKPEELKSPPVEGYHGTIGFNLVCFSHFVLFVI